MIHSIKRLIGYRLAALDGEIGRLKDLYFEDGEWSVRYGVAEAGSWLHSRQVLLSPRAFGEIERGDKALHVKLSREQIRHSPPSDTHKPVSRQYEEAYHQYYGWPYYWQGAALWGMSGFPVLHQRSDPFLGEQARIRRGGKDRRGSLRSVQVVSGYRIQAGNDFVGRLADFLVDDESWCIQSCVVHTGPKLAGKKVLISTERIESISWDASTVHVDVPKLTLQRAPSFDEKSLETTKMDRERMTFFV